jgi:hypothetical protein
MKAASSDARKAAAAATSSTYLVRFNDATSRSMSELENSKLASQVAIY